MVATCSEAYSRVVETNNPFILTRDQPNRSQHGNTASFPYFRFRTLLLTRSQSAQTRTADARFSTYSGAPSLQPSLAPTYSTGGSANASQRNTQTINEKQPAANSGSSFYANAEQGAASSSTLNSNDPKTQDIKQWSRGFERMQDERLDKQRYVMSGNKSEEVSKLALGAKLERALGRRMTGQDASFSRSKRPQDSEKASLEVEVN